MPDVPIALSSGTQTQVLASGITAPYFYRVMSFNVSASAATNFQLYSGPNLADSVFFNGTTPPPFSPFGLEVAGIFDCGIGQPLLASSTVGVNVEGTLKYTIKP